MSDAIAQGQPIINAIIVDDDDHTLLKPTSKVCTLGKEDFESMTMEQIMNVNDPAMESSYACYLKYYHGFQEALVFYYAFTGMDITSIQERKLDCVIEFASLKASVSPEQRALVKEKGRKCVMEAESDLTSFLTTSIPNMASEMTKTTEDRKKTVLLMCDVINSGKLFNKNNNYDPEDGKMDIDMDTFLKLQSKQASLYTQSGMINFVLKLDKKANIYENCDVNISNEEYYDKSQPFKHSKSRSLKNLGHKNQCPSRHVMVDEANYDTLFQNKNHRKRRDFKIALNLYRRNRGCCLYQPSIKHVANAVLTAKRIGKGIWKWESLQKLAHEALQDISEDLVAIKNDIKVKESVLKQETNPLKRIPLECELKQLKKSVELLTDQAAYIQLTDKTEMFEKAQKELEAYRSSWLANTGSGEDRFVERIRIEIVYGIEIMVKKYLFTDLKNKVKKADKLSVKNILVNIRALKDYSLGILIWMIKHPKFSVFIIGILEKYKKDMCDRIAVENGKFKLETQSKVNIDKLKSEVVDKGYWIVLSVLTDPAAINKLMTQFSAGIQVFTSSMGPYGMALSGVLHILQVGFSDNILRAINTSAWTLTYLEGTKKFMKLLDLSRCGVEATIVANNLKLVEDNKFVKRAKEIAGFFTHDPIQVVLPQNPPLSNIEFTIPSDNSKSYYIAIIAIALMGEAAEKKSDYEKREQNDLNLEQSEFEDIPDMMTIVDRSQANIKIVVFRKLVESLKNDIPQILQKAKTEYDKGMQRNIENENKAKRGELDQYIMDVFPERKDWQGIRIVTRDLTSNMQFSDDGTDEIPYGDEEEEEEDL